MLRGYRRVFEFERRLFRFDRWRIPYPHGIPLRGIGYFLVLVASVFVASRLPLVGAVLAAAPFALAYLALPLGGAFALTAARIEGRPPHHVLASLVGYALRPRCLAGLMPCPDRGEYVVSLAEVDVAYDGRESFPVKGRIQGPARVTVRYPAICHLEGLRPWIQDCERRAAMARRYRVVRATGGAPMLQGKTIVLPAGKELVVE